MDKSPILIIVDDQRTKDPNFIFLARKKDTGNLIDKLSKLPT
jgi:hypothetical protein